MEKEKYRNEHLSFDIFLEEAYFENIRILGQNVKGYTGKYIVFDNFDFWNVDKLFETKEEAMGFVDALSDVKNKQEYNFIKWCLKHEIREGSIIELEDGKRGSILGSEHADGNIKYSPIKKDGSIGKSIRRLYSGTKFKVVKY